MNANRNTDRRQSQSGNGVATPLGLIATERSNQRQLCDHMEMVADQLPDILNETLCSQIYTALRFQLPLHHRNEEALYEIICRQVSPATGMVEIVAKVRHEHTVHECYADEFSDTLSVLRPGNGPHWPDAMGYMLRGYFETMRRHLDWEELTLFPLARTLSRSDLDQLSRALEANRRATPPPAP